MLSGEATDNKLIVFGLTRTGLELKSTTLETSTLTITPPMRFNTEIRHIIGQNVGHH